MLLMASMTVGLASCASNNAENSWSKPDDSPWSGKRAAEAETAAAEEELAYDPNATYEPVPLYEPEPQPVVEEPVVVNEPEPMDAPMTVVTEEEPATAEASVEDIILALPANSYAVQVYASKTMASIEGYQKKNELNDLHIVKTDRSGEVMYVLVGMYDDRASATAAADTLQEQTGSKPWVRSIAGLQKIISK